ncbi:antitoxin VapB family protein (plasmid) [Haloarcula salina]|uniref:antitoxin VapB family protein n=1 Tax=Haloarcula salina TaxID=1429914 RepID=UPI003C6FDA23
MGRKTIKIQDDVYERLKARKRDSESFSDFIDRLLYETSISWREGLGTLTEQEAAELEQIVSESQNHTAEGLSERQQEALKTLFSSE